MLLLTTTGRKSGEKRTTPLIYQLHGDDYLVVASNGGGDPPGWFLNLQAIRAWNCRSRPPPRRPGAGRHRRGEARAVAHHDRDRNALRRVSGEGRPRDPGGGARAGPGGQGRSRAGVAGSRAPSVPNASAVSGMRISRASALAEGVADGKGGEIRRAAVGKVAQQLWVVGPSVAGIGRRHPDGEHQQAADDPAPQRGAGPGGDVPPARAASAAMQPGPSSATAAG